MADHPEVIDVHAHVFNARYLPLEGIFLSHLGELSTWKRWVAQGVATILNHATASSYSSRLRLATIHTADEILDDIWRCVAAELEDRTKGLLFAASDRPVREYVTDRLEDDPLLQALMEARAILVASGDDPDEPRRPDDLSPIAAEALAAFRLDRRHQVEQLTRSLSSRSSEVDGLFHDLSGVLKWLLKKFWNLLNAIPGWWDTFLDLLTFVRRMLMAERDIFVALRNAYDDDQNVGAFVHHMMDMHAAYPGAPPPRYLFPEQQRRMLKLANDAGGRLIGFTAFDPRHTTGWQMPKDFTGVKIYPAMGYRPWDNAEPIQSRVAAFLKACVTDDVPVFAHCTPRGFQAKPGWGNYAHPKHWRAALESDGLAGLRLCLGHAGGGRMENSGLVSHGWFARNRDEWNDKDNFAAIAVYLCTTYEHVYCEVGHLHELLESGSHEEAFVRNFVQAWTATGSRYTFATKCMFGSDHHMPAMINVAKDLLRYFEHLFRRERLDGFDRFCAGNARAYLNPQPERPGLAS
jgi:hypothetical protein